MSRSSVLIMLGALTILAPFSGLPSAIRTLIAIGLGVAVIGIGVAMRSKEQRRLLAAEPPTSPEATQGTAPPEISPI